MPRINYKRKKNGKTDYRRRLNLLRSRKLRLVVRKSTHNIRAQVVEYSPKGDIIKVSAFSKELEKFGWQYSKKNIPAAFLTGYLCGKRCTSSEIKEAILDSGRETMIHGGKLYAVLKGAIDGGLKIECSGEIFPSEERLNGKHIADYASTLDKKSSNQFSRYAKNKTDPTEIQDQFKNTLKNIDKELK